MNRTVCGICWALYDDEGLCECPQVQEKHMTTLREAAQQALEALEDYHNGSQKQDSGAAITALRAALAEPEQEPVAWIEHGLVEAPDGLVWEKGSVGYYTPLYTHPPRRTGLPHCERSCEANAFKIEIRRLKAALEQPERRLTDEVIADLWHQNGGFYHRFARAIERYLKGQE